jgi:hypothetical protein
MLPKVHSSENGDVAISARPQYRPVRLRLECAVALPPPDGSRGCVGTILRPVGGVGHIVPCAVRQGSSGSAGTDWNIETTPRGGVVTETTP